MGVLKWRGKRQDLVTPKTKTKDVGAAQQHERHTTLKILLYERDFQYVVLLTFDQMK